MKKIIPLIAILANSLFCTAQNLVSNSNFASIYHCPTSNGQLDSCVGWYPLGATPDYFNACTDPSTFPGWIAHVPGNFYGYQESFAHAYAGIGVHTSEPNYREYFGATIPAMVVGGTYRVTIGISFGDSSGLAVKGFGVHFYDLGTPPDTLVHLYHVTPQIDFTSYGVLNNMVNWTTMTGTFVADSAYTHIMIGNYLSDADQGVTVNPVHCFYCADLSYYFIDTVAVERIPPVSINGTDILPVASVRPNPASGSSIISFDNFNSAPYLLKVFDVSGRVVRTLTDITGDNVKVDYTDMPAGMYYFSLTGDRVYNGKLMVQ